ncbi:GNAT family N-acetyltransferase [Tumebacillus permanentifrigoris]|uniref:Acetyltransferase (GNAT) family protein n=1 Tax=Tumebacillus permanentifrigoris TaxID=378543 RepID=A0A316DPI2_9BACL|nr:GNAT family N-acetyltransferase [Tumebacillus permanentifrigoris]PWK04996.1 acetyltransferase (GNAT) family protein [Tumebacillus permanentifrigoris]
MYRKELFVFDPDKKPLRAVIRSYTQADFADLIEVQRVSFPPPFPSELWWNEEQLHNHVTLFPQGALCVEVEGQVVGSMTGLRVQIDPAHPLHTWAEITDDGYIRNHDPHGDTLYIVDISVMPAFRHFGLGKLLMQSMYEVVIHTGLRRLLGGGRMSGYHRHAETMSAEQYLEKVTAGDLYDPVITFLLRCGRMPIAVVPEYLEDEESRNYAALMEWENPFLT